MVTPDERKEMLLQEKMRSPKWYIRWAAKALTKEFNHGLTKYLIAAYVGFILYGGYYFSEMYSKEKEANKLINKKYNTSNKYSQDTSGRDYESKDGLNEYENLRLRELTGKLRERDAKKLEKYKELIEEKEGEYFEDPKHLGEEYVLDPRVFDNTTIDVDIDADHSMLPARNTTEFYDSKAADFDYEVGWEERLSLIGRRRKWLMNKAFGDVLEVACGTGRNIKYLDLDKISSITCLDPSVKMIEIAQEKFQEAYPSYKKAAFVVGRAEDLADLAKGGGEDARIKYDTIIESFGICSHENPKEALKNFGQLLKPGGRVVLLEHGRGTWDFINKYLDNRAEKRLDTWGCRWNLDIGELLDDSGLEIVEEKRHQFGTIWCAVLKRAGDVKRYEELSIYEKYFSTVDAEK